MTRFFNCKEIPCTCIGSLIPGRALNNHVNFRFYVLLLLTTERNDKKFQLRFLLFCGAENLHHNNIDAYVGEFDRESCVRRAERSIAAKASTIIRGRDTNK